MLPQEYEQQQEYETNKRQQEYKGYQQEQEYETMKQEYDEYHIMEKLGRMKNMSNMKNKNLIKKNRVVQLLIPIRGLLF